jgi:hypothetical protein
MTPEQASGHGMQAHVGKNLGGTLAFMSEDFLRLALVSSTTLSKMQSYRSANG